MKTNEEEFLLEEFKESIKTGQWLEEMLERKFKTFSVVFLWQVVLLGFLLKDEFACKDILQVLSDNYIRGIVIITSMFVFVFSLVTVDNLVKTRIGDVLRTARTNFLRGHFLKTMPDDFKKEYFENNRMKYVNRSEIYGRPAWSYDSDVAYYVILIALMGSISLAIFIASLFTLNYYILGLIIIILPILATLYSRRKVNKHIASK